MRNEKQPIKTICQTAITAFWDCCFPLATCCLFFYRQCLCSEFGLVSICDVDTNIILDKVRNNRITQMFSHAMYNNAELIYFCHFMVGLRNNITWLESWTTWLGWNYGNRNKIHYFCKLTVSLTDATLLIAMVAQHNTCKHNTLWQNVVSFWLGLGYDITCFG